MIYTTTKNGYAVTWAPDETELATQALDEVAGKAAGSEIPPETAQKVRFRYKELHVQKYGSDSPYHEVVE